MTMNAYAKRHGWASLLIALTVCAASASSQAQNSSLYPPDYGGAGSMSLQQGSWIYRPLPPPREIQLNDIVIVRVDELARVQSDGEMERRKNALYDALLQDWVFLDGLKAVRPSAQSDGDPRLRGQLQQLYRAEADLETSESLALNIACRVADIRPNGNLVLEGHKEIIVNDEVWMVSLSGICRREDVGPDGLVLSRHITDLKVDKRERGHVRDGYRRGWMLRLMDQFAPF